MRKIISNYKYVLKVMKKVNKKNIFFQIIYGIFSTLYFTINIYFPKLIVDEIILTKNYKKTIVIILLMVISTAVVKSLTMFFEINQSNSFCRSRDLLKVEIGKKKMMMDFKNTEDPLELDKQKKVMEVTYQFPKISFDVFATLIGSILKVIITIYFLSSLNYIIIFFIAINTVITYKINKKSSEILNNYAKEKCRDDRGKSFLLTLTGDYKAGKTIRAYNLSDYIINKYNTFYYNILEIEKRIEHYSRKINLKLSVIDYVQVMVIYIYMVIQYKNGKLTIGDFMIVLNATMQFVNALKSLIDVIVKLNTASFYIDEYKGFMEMKEDYNSSDTIVKMPNEVNTIEFKNVFFRYPNQKGYTLKNINLKVSSKQKLMLVGENGSGKSTFIKLLLRLYDPSEGEILLNGINIKKFRYQEYLKIVSTVFQDFKIFSYTIKENVCFDNELKKDDVVYILKEVNLYEKIKNLPKGLDSNIGVNLYDDGIEFSGGEMQRLAMSRALFKDSYINILDEPTSALDPISEYEIFKTYNNNVSEKLVFYVSHRLAVSRMCDVIFVFNNGEIVEKGKHYQLLKQEGVYADMYKKQASLYSNNILE